MSTTCQGRRSGGKLIGALQVHNPRLDEVLEISDYLRPVAGFEGKAWTGAPPPSWSAIHALDGTWSAETRFVKDSPEQELLGHDDVQKVTEFLVQVAHDRERCCLAISPGQCVCQPPLTSRSAG